MTKYFRITGYSPEYDICFIMDSNGMFKKLWEFSVFIREHGCKVLEVSSDEKFIDINIEKADSEPNKIIIRASATGKPTYSEKTIDGVTYKAIEVEGKIYIPER